jgi:5-methylcytosine-specific restriction endonuclease McrA
MIQRDCERKARHDAGRPTARERGYDSKWDKERAAYLKAHPRCVMCGAPATIVHHKTPHRGDRKLFWDRKNWSPVCKPCHDGPLQSMEKRR